MSATTKAEAMTADQIIDAMKDTDWKLPVLLDTDPPREIIGVQVEEREGDPAFRIVLQTQPVD